MAEGLEGLRIFQLAEELADRVWNAVLPWEPFAKRTVGQQLVEAGDSVGANIAEGYGRFHYKDNRQFQYYARGSLHEMRYWLRRSHTRKLISEDCYQTLIRRVDELTPQLNAYIRSLQHHAKTAQSKSSSHQVD